MTVAPDQKKHYTARIMEAIETKSTPLTIRTILTEVKSKERARFNADIAVAVIWNLLASNELRFDQSRRIKLSSR